MKKRLLIIFSYIGTNYCGLQKQKSGTDLKSVQGILESTFKYVVKHPVVVHISSRTDTGVHALESSAHVDIPEETANLFRFSSPEKLCQNFNTVLDVNGTDIRVRKIVEVPLDFHCRHSALSRSYCYRLAVCKEDSLPTQCASHQRPSGTLPISELYRCQVVQQPFDVGIVSQACSVFVGTWNFRSFAHSSKDYEKEGVTEKVFIKTLKRFSLSKAKPDYVNPWDKIHNNFDFYDINIESSGFLRRQVRRMVGSLISLGRGDISYEDILFMLENPDARNWNSKCAVASPHGLFLKSINYKDIPVLRGPFI